MSHELQPLQLGRLVDPVREIAREASREILQVYESDFSIAEKEDKSPVTAADLAAHAVIVKGLRNLTPDIPILSEESVQGPFSERSGWTRYWLVDPLDGTKEFIKRNGEFTVNIALIEGHVASLGVVHVPVTNTTYFAARGTGCFKDEPGIDQPRALTTRRADAAKLVVSGSRSHGGDVLQEFIRGLPGDVELITSGSSLKLCLVAEGRADIYPRFGLTSEWDTAAAQCVVEQAGGTVTDMEFRPILYNAKENILNPHFLVIGDQSFEWRHLIPGAKSA